MKIGINPLTWSNDDLPRLGKDNSLEQCLKEAAEAGYQGIELGHKFPRDPTVLRPLLEHYNLQLIAGWYGSNLLRRSVKRELKQLSPHLELLKSLGAEVVIFCEVHGAIHGKIRKSLALRPYLPARCRMQFYESLSEVSDYITSHGLKMAYQHHMGTVIQSEADIIQLMDNTPPSVGLLLDSGHLHFARGNFLNCITDHIDRLTHIHLKDIRSHVLESSLSQNFSFLNAVCEGVFTVPGDGCLDYAPLIRLLKQYGYSDWLVVEAEQDPSKAPPLEYATKGFEHVTHLLNTVTA